MADATTLPGISSIVTNEIDSLSAIAEQAITAANSMQTSLMALLSELTPPESTLSDLELPEITPIDYTGRPDIGSVTLIEPDEAPDSTIDFDDVLELDTSDIESAADDLDLVPFDYNPPEKPTFLTLSSPDILPVDASFTPNSPTVDITIDDLEAFSGITLDTDIPDIVTPSMPDLPSFPDKPSLSFNLSSLPESPSINSIDLPSKPDVTIPAAPTFSEIIPPNSPVLDFTPLLIEKPILELESKLPAEFDYSPDNYVSSVWNTLLAKIKDDIQTGGVGVNADVRDGMYQELVDLQREEHERQYREAQARYGALGFALPTGAFVSALSEVSLENSRQEEGFRRKVYLDQMTLAQQNTQWAMDKGVQLEQILREFFNQSENRRIEVSKAIAQRGIDIFQAYVTKFNAEVDLYKAEAATQETLLRGELAKVEMYKAEMSGKSIEAEVQKTQADLYTAQLGAIELRSKIFQVENESAKILAEMESLKIEQYKAMLEGYIASLDYDKNVVALYATEVDAEKTKQESLLSRVGIETEIEKLKVDSYSTKINAEVQQETAKVQAYSVETGALTEVARARASIEATRVGALTEIEKNRANIHVANMQSVSDLNKSNIDIYTAQTDAEKTKIGLYESEIRAEGAKIEIYAQQVQTLVQKISALKAILDAEAINATNTIQMNNQQIEKYKAELMAYEADLNYVKSTNEALTGMFGVEATIYSTETDAIKAENLTKIEEMKTYLQRSSLEVQQLTEELKLITQGYVAVKELQVEGTQGLMNVQAQLASSAMAANNVSASIDGSLSATHSYAY